MRQRLRRHLFRRSGRVDDAKTLRLGVCTREETLAHAFEEVVVLALDAIRTASTRREIASAGTFAATGDADVEQQGHPRFDADNAAFEVGNEIRIQPAP